MKERQTTMSIFASIGRIAAEFSAARARHQTARTIRSLPVEIQKDIGWPPSSTAKSVGSGHQYRTEGN